MPLHLITVFNVSRKGKDIFSCLGWSKMQRSVHAARNKKGSFICALNRYDLGFSWDRPSFSFADIPKWDFTISTPQQQKLIIELKPRDIKDGFLNEIKGTISSDTAIVLRWMPSRDLICTPPLPTTPKLAAVPSARRPGAWGDHLTQV